MQFRLLIALVVAAACGGGGSDSPTTPIIPSSPSNPIATTSVSMQNDTFNPSDIIVAPSAVVTFTNADGINHNVIFANQAITSLDTWASGARTVTMPATPGTYNYTCTIHAGMNGTIKVQ
jgi:plastocyanin